MALAVLPFQLLMAAVNVLLHRNYDFGSQRAELLVDITKVKVSTTFSDFNIRSVYLCDIHVSKCR